MVAEELGITLAPRDSPEKSFGPSTEGCVYGINYDTVSQSWWIGEDKMARIMGFINEFLNQQEVQAEKVWSLARKINHVKDLVVGGRFHVEEILRTNNMFTDKKKDRNKMVPITKRMTRELWWWTTMLQVCANRTKYTDTCLPAWLLEA